MNYTVHGILQARIFERVAYPFSRGSSQPRRRTQISHIAGRGKPKNTGVGSLSLLQRIFLGVSCIAGGFLTNWAIREGQYPHFQTFVSVRKRLEQKNLLALKPVSKPSCFKPAPPAGYVPDSLVKREKFYHSWHWLRLEYQGILISQKTINLDVCSRLTSTCLYHSCSVRGKLVPSLGKQMDRQLFPIQQILMSV